MKNRKSLSFIAFLFLGVGLAFSAKACDSTSYTSSSSAFEFIAGINAKSDMCGTDQYYKVTVPSGKKCDIAWALQPDATADYDLCVKWTSGSIPVRNSCDQLFNANTGITEQALKTQLSSGIYYILAYKFGGTGSYTILSTIGNCVNDSATPTQPTVPKTVSLVSPNGGESWEIGKTYEIKWQSASISKVNIDLSLGTGIQAWRLATGIPATDGKFNWTPQLSSSVGTISPGNTFKIIIWETENLAIADQSDNYFNIIAAQSSSKSITVTSPNGGEQWQRGNTYDIKWNSTGVEKVGILISYLESPLRCLVAPCGEVIASNLSASTGKYSWTVPTSQVVTFTAHIIVQEVGTLKYDESDNYFSVTSTGSSTTTTGCSSQYTTFSAAADLQNGGAKSGMCGKEQYYKVAIASGQTCDLKWTLQSNSNSDYDLYTRWSADTLSRDNYLYRSFNGAGQNDELSKTGLGAGTYYVLVYSENTPTGNYNITAALSNCSSGSGTTAGSTTNNTTTNTTTGTGATSSQITDLQNQINQLLSQISQLRSQLNTAITNQQSTPSSPVVNNSGEWCYSFVRNLKYLDSGDDVMALQKALYKEGLYLGKIGGNFGTLTLNSVVRFQQKYLTPYGLSMGTGFVGNATLKKLNELYGCE